MRGVGDESALRLVRVLQPAEHAVEARRQPRHLVLASAARQPPAKVPFASDLLGRNRHRLQRGERPARHQPRGKQRGDQGRDGRDDQEDDDAGQA